MIRRPGLFLLALAAIPIAHAAPRIQERPCPPALYAGRCGYIEVPENRSVSGGRTIHLEFVQIRSTAAHPEPDAWIDIAGGPGIPSTPGAAEMVGIFGYVLRHRDIVLYDQRGTGGSNFLHCDLRQDDAPGQLGDFLPPAGVRRCYREMAGRANLASYNTAAGVEDLEDLRQTLGYDRLTLHALSYGTRLGQAYLQAHPDHVRAAIFEGALQPGARIPLSFAMGMQHTLDAVLDDCRRSAECKPVADGINLNRIATTPQFTFTVSGQTIQLTPTQFFEQLRVLLYDGEGARRVPLILNEVSRGDTRSLPKLWQAAHGDDPRYSWPLWLSVTCAEDTPFIREEQIAPATRGTWLGDYRIRQQQRACRDWPVPRRDPAVGKPVAAPVLLVEGQLDLVTPPWNQADVRRYFPHGRQIVLPHTGHMPIGLAGVECIDTLEQQFLETLNPGAVDPACVNSIHRLPFVVAEAPGTN